MDVDTFLDDADPAQLRAILDDDYSEDDSTEEMYLDDIDDDDDDYEEGSEAEGEEDYIPGDTKGPSLNFSDEDGFEDEDEDDEHSFYDALREVRNFKPKKKKGAKKKGLNALKRKMRREGDLSPEVKVLLSKANEDFVSDRLTEAMAKYQEVIKLDSKNFAAYKTLGEIYQSQGELNKCSNAWFIAAHLHPWDHEFWRTLAELSVNLNHTRQAIYCFSKAISASNQSDYSSVFERAILYRKKGQYKRAIESLQKLKTILPQESRIIREISLVYVEQNRINDAITMYNKILDENVTHRKLHEQEPSIRLKGVTFTWSELNILSELYGKKAAWEVGAKVIRNISRWIQNRETQTFWTNVDNDSEFDDRRRENSKFQSLSPEEQGKDYSLPIDIRVQLGTFRLNSKRIDESLIHFDFLLNENIDDTSDLYFNAGNELERHGLYFEALKFLCELTYVDGYSTPELILSIARCFRETKDYESAKEAYAKLLEYDPNNVEYKVALAEVWFCIGELNIAAQLHAEARKQIAENRQGTARSNLANLKQVDEEGAVSDLDEESLDDLDLDESMDIFDDDGSGRHTQALIAELPSHRKKRPQKEHLSEEDIHAMETRSSTRVQEKFSRASRLFPGVQSGHSFAVTTWIDIVAELIEIFSTYRVFFSSDRAKKLNSGLRKRTAKLAVDKQLSRMAYLRDEMRLSKAVDMGKIKISDDNEKFKGVSYDDWFDLFMRYALVTAGSENSTDDTLVVQEIVRNVNVFREDSRKGLVCSLVCVAAGMKTGDYVLSMNQLRNLMNEYQFSIPILKTFIASALPVQNSIDNYADAPNQKYILRQIKAYDSIRTGRDIVNMATITNNEVDKRTIHPILDYIYCTFLFENKSYPSALSYALRCYSHFNKDPSITLLVGLTYLHRSVQRLTANRNFQVLQAFTFLAEYAELQLKNGTVYERMEVNYNFGRAFHQLNLLSLAITSYENVLAVEEDEIEEKAYDLRLDAAYNLYLIYNYNGNPGLAADILNTYLVI